ncbi:MAG: DUF3127 domain-containing protein [Candidatus Shikimatogenerans sp. Tduv]|uniref:DUF3127 domain-containing protein n=1 Tax=Candidatus Shikimatogenerans sp. Tduv TaxID=3158567 RepID=A0AAU7QRV2_9FLAO
MYNIKILGKIKKIFSTKKFGSFKKKELLLKTEEQYPQNILIDFIQEKCKLLKKVKKKDKVIVSINIRGRKWVNNNGEKKYFNNIQGWKIEKYKNSNKNNKNPINTDLFDDL